MHVAYVTVGAADDVHAWSGLTAAIRESIERQGCRVTPVDRLGASYPMRMRLRKRLLAWGGKTYALDRTPFASGQWSMIASERLARLSDVDAVVSPSTLPVAHLQTAAPLLLWLDATFHSLRTTYPEYAAYSRRSIDDGERTDAAAFDRATLICFASSWAAEDAIAYYAVPRSKVRVIEFGAIAQTLIDDDSKAVQAIDARSASPLHFAFIGVDWRRKGGPMAVEIVRLLNDCGVASTLTIAGCDPPPDVASLPFVRTLGFLSKKTEAGRARLHATLADAHFLLLPTTADCFGLVFAEAAAFAVPSISRNVGGVSSAVRDGETGLLLPTDAPAHAYRDAITALTSDWGRYREMARAAHRDFRRRLNWHVAGGRVTAELSALAGRPVAAIQ